MQCGTGQTGFKITDENDNDNDEHAINSRKYIQGQAIECPPLPPISQGVDEPRPKLNSVEEGHST